MSGRDKNPLTQLLPPFQNDAWRKILDMKFSEIISHGRRLQLV